MELFRPKLILVPTDFSDRAGCALRYASGLAERFGAHLLVLYADPFVLPMDYSTTAAQAVLGSQEMADKAREELEIHAEQNISTKAPYDTRVIVGSPVNAIIEQACEVGADLIVMGTHGRTGFRRLLVGSITEAVIRLATTPVIAVKSNTPANAQTRNAFCAVTFTAASRLSVEYAAAFAKRPVLFHGVEEYDLKDTFDELIKIREWAPKALLDRCEVKIAPSFTPAEDVVEFAKLTNADLIALGVPDGRSFTDAFSGTLVEQIVQRAGCPVLTVNERTVRHLTREKLEPVPISENNPSVGSRALGRPVRSTVDQGSQP
jgi:nucleotide-binding universal stress UspA family protein